MGKSKNLSHESFDRKEELVVGSDKKFGYVFAALFFLIGISSLLISAKIRALFFMLSVSFLAAALLNPSALHPLNKLWMRFGLLLNKVVSPLVLAVLFFLVFTPLGLALRLFGKDVLNLKIQKNIKSYWIDSTQTLPTSMKDQF